LPNDMVAWSAPGLQTNDRLLSRDFAELTLTAAFLVSRLIASPVTGRWPPFGLLGTGTQRARRGSRSPGVSARFLVEDVLAQGDTLVADPHAGPGDEPEAWLVLALAAERAAVRAGLRGGPL